MAPDGAAIVARLRCDHWPSWPRGWASARCSGAGADALLGVGIAAGVAIATGRAPPAAFPAHGSSLAQMARGTAPPPSSWFLFPRRAPGLAVTAARLLARGMAEMAPALHDSGGTCGGAARHSGKTEGDGCASLLAGGAGNNTRATAFRAPHRPHAARAPALWLGVPHAIGGAAAAFVRRGRGAGRA